MYVYGKPISALKKLQIIDFYLRVQDERNRCGILAAEGWAGFPKDRYAFGHGGF
jgi:hypothetical protein